MPDTKKWPLIEEIKFLNVVPEHLRKELEHIDYASTKSCSAKVGDTLFKQFKHQAIVTKFMSQDTPYRGLLLYHQTGVGKTCAMIGIAEANPSRVTVVLLPASLKHQFIESIKFCGGPRYKVTGETAEERALSEKQVNERINKKYIFISSNASNTGDLLDKNINEHRKKYEENKKNKSHTSDTDVRSSSHETDNTHDDMDILNQGSTQDIDIWQELQDRGISNLDNKLLIVDEAHSLISNIASPLTKNGDKIRDAIEEAENLKIVLSTGTPVISDPFELAILFNIIAGKRGKHYPFPEKYGAFHDIFVDRASNSIKNKALFQERINGLVSFYSSVSTIEENHLVPSLTVEVLEIPMSQFQWSHYIAERQREIEEERKSRTRSKKIEGYGKIPGSENSGSYRMATRQISNFIFPKEFPKPMPPKGNKTKENVKEYLEKVQSVINEIPADYLTKNLPLYSPKMAEVLTLLNNKRGKVLIYSDFLKAEGLGVLSRVLRLHGYKLWKSTDMTSGKPNMEYAIWSGDTPQNERNKIKDIFNDTENNLTGEKLRILMITSAGSEGLDLKGVETVIILEPYWHKARLRQIIGRAQRICSHSGLPPERNKVNVYVLLAVPPVGIISQKVFHLESEKYVTDQHLLKRSNRRRFLLDQFEDAMRSMAFDCSLLWDHNKASLKESCRTCIQTGADLGKFPADFDIHKQKLRCLAPDTKKLSLIAWQGKEYGLDERTKEVYDINQIPAIVIGKLDENDDVKLV